MGDGFFGAFGRARRERELDDEIRAHVAMAVEDRVARGESREAAERAVRREFGNEARVREVTRMMWGSLWWDRLAQDLRLGVRSLLRHPRYSLASVLTLTLGLTASVTIFSVVETVLLRPLPYEDADRLVMLETELMSLGEIDGSSVPNVRDWGELSGSVEALTYFRRPRVSQVTVLGPDPRRVQEGLVGPGFFDVTRAAPVAGRTFTDDELQRGEPVALVRADLWEEMYGSDGFAPGQSLLIGEERHTIVGVLPPEFQLPTRDTRLWRPITLTAWWSEWSTSRLPDGVVALARLRAGTSFDEAQAELSTVAERLRAAYEGNADKDVRLTPLAAAIGVERDARQGLWLLFSAVLLLLVLACANVAGLSAARGSLRAREMGIRSAIGAGRRVLVRQLVTEAGVLAAVASASAFGLAYLAVRAVQRFGPAELPRFEQLSLSPTALLFALLAGAATVALFGVLPALSASQVAPGDALKSGGPTQGRSSAFNDLLVTGQLALATVLLVTGGLLVESFRRATAVDPGYPPERLAIVSVDLPESRYPSVGALFQFHREARSRLEELPGVQAAGSISGFFQPALAAGTDPLGRSERVYSVEGGVTDWPEGRRPAIGGGGGGGVTDGYLEALGIPLIDGRYLTTRDLEISVRNPGTLPEAVVVNETMAELFWPGGDPIGRHFQFGTEVYDPSQFSYEVVGVAADLRTRGLDQDAGPSFYGADIAERMDIVVRGSVDAAGLLTAIRSTLRELDPQLPVEISTAEQVLGERLSLRRFQSGLVAAFALMALLLSTGGVYALLTYYVARRTREIGIRRALGASRGAALGLVARRSVRPVALGLAVGLALSGVLASALGSLLFEVGALDWGTYLGTSLLLLVAAAAAAYFPAAAASRIEPLEAVQAEG